MKKTLIERTTSKRVRNNVGALNKRLGRISLFVIIAALTLVSFTGCGSSASAEQTSSASAQAGSEQASGDQSQVTRVRIAHTQAYFPYDFVNEKGESDGFEVQVMKAVDELLPEYEFELVPTSDDDLLIGIESGKYHGGTKGAWHTAERAEKYIYPENYIGASVIGLAIRTENAQEITDIESFARFSGKLVPIAPQSAQWAIVSQYNESNPDNQIDLKASETFNVADAYIWVLEGRYDGYFDIQLSYQNNITNEGAPYGQYAEQLSYVPYKGIPTWPLFNKNEQALADAYDKALLQLRESGVLAELSEEYFGEDIFKYIKD